MAFSLNSGQAAPQAGQGIAPVGVPAAESSGLPSVPNSPFLFMRHRGEAEKPIWVYIQIVLMAVASLSVVVCVVLYGYSVYLTSHIASVKEELIAKDAGFKDYPFDDMRRFSLRMATLKSLLDGYVAAESPLLFLEKVVEKQVVFNNFALQNGPTGYTINFLAVTNNYRALIQQLAALNLTQYKRIAPTPKPGDVNDSTGVIKIQVTSPVLVQGKLPSEIESLFVVDPNATTTATGSTTP